MRRKKTNYGYVSPLKSQRELNIVEDTLLYNFGNAGRRNYTIWQICKCDLLRIEDTLGLRYNQIYDKDHSVKSVVRIHDHKTRKINILNLTYLSKVLKKYDQWRSKQHRYDDSPWLFPAYRNPSRPLNKRYCYNILQKVSNLTRIKNLGTHSARKTGALIVYRKTGNLALVMRLLNHSNESVTLRYLGLDRSSINHELNHINFEKING